jgi:hypothetical protein
MKSDSSDLVDDDHPATKLVTGCPANHLFDDVIGPVHDTAGLTQ